MDNPPSPDEMSTGLEGETPAERAARIEREAVLLAQADAEMDAGYWLDEDEADAWLKAVAMDPTTPMPQRKDRPA